MRMHAYLQVALLGIQFMWTLDCEDALYRAKSEKGVMQQAARKNTQRLNELVAINLTSDGELSAHGAWTRTKVETILTTLAMSTRAMTVLTMTARAQRWKR